MGIKSSITKALIFALVAPIMFAGVAGAVVGSSSDTHTIKFNIYDSTSLTTLIESCDDIKAEQEKNGTYTKETYEKLMKACEGATTTLDCLEQGKDITECGDPENKKKDVDDAINNLKPNTDPPGTGAESTWYVTMLGRNYAIPTFPFVMLSIATLAGIILTIFLIRRHIRKQGIGGIKVTNPWSNDSYKLAYEKGMVKKHAKDPLTKVVDVSNIIRKYRIKFALWHTVPVLAIIAVFVTLVLATAPTEAQSEYADIVLTTTDGATVTIVNVDKATAGGSLNAASNIEQIFTNIHSGGKFDSHGSVFAKYSAKPSPSQSIGDFTALLNNMTLTATRVKSVLPGSANMVLSGVVITESTTTNPLGQKLVPVDFDSTSIVGENTFDHTLTIDLTNVQSIPNGSYSVELTYTLTVEEPNPQQAFTFTVADTSYSCTFNAMATTHFYRVPAWRYDKNTYIPYDYDWLITIDKDTPNQIGPINYSGTASSDFIDLDLPCDESKQWPEGYATNTITIASNGPANIGWARAFGVGCLCEAIDYDVIHIDTPLPLNGFMNASYDASYAFANVFAGMSNLTNAMSIDTSYVNMKNISNFKGMFSGTHSNDFTLDDTMDLSNLDTSGGTDFSFMFEFTHYKNWELKTAMDISFLDTSNGTTFWDMFYGTHYRNTVLETALDASGLDTANGESFAFMFAETHNQNHALTTPINVSGMDTSSGTDFKGMFFSTHNDNYDMVTPIDPSGIDVSNGTEFDMMFAWTHYNNPALTNAAIGDMRFHDSLKTKYSLWNINNGTSATFNQTFERFFGDYDTTVGEEPKYNDGTVLSSAGAMNLTSGWGPYSGRPGIAPPPLYPGWL